MILDTHNTNECCGCAACESVCPAAAIRMKPDEKGFLIPERSSQACIHCGLCLKTCDFSAPSPCENSVIKVFGLHHRSKAVRQTSRSGGAFRLLAEQVIAKGGSVWGAAFDQDLRVVHAEAKTPGALKALQGSKYVQSDTRGVFAQIHEQLKADRHVLFSGTACQTAALLAYLKIRKADTGKLLTCDIICQGVPSPKLFEEYKALLEKKHSGRLAEFRFRDKARIGWEGHEESFRFANSRKTHYSRTYTNYYYRYPMRESCFECKYAALRRPGDLTLGDFWGVRRRYPHLASEDGNSLVLVNTEKGLRFFTECCGSANAWEAELAACLQPRLTKPSEKPKDYGLFWQEYASKGAAFCMKKYGREPLKARLVYLIKPPLRKLGLIGQKDTPAVSFPCAAEDASINDTHEKD